jgi:putative flippase GtrA
VGTAATGLQLLLYTGLRLVWGPLSANLLAMLVSTLAGIELNRRLTFGARGRARLLRQYAGSVAVFLVGLALSSAGLALITELDPGAARRTELLTLLTVAVLVGLIRFFLLREWVFPRREPVNE